MARLTLAQAKEILKKTTTEEHQDISAGAGKTAGGLSG